MKKGEYPHGKCEELRSHAMNMVATIGDLIGKKKATKFSKKVMKVWEIERMHKELQRFKKPKDKKIRIEKLDEAAGYFRAVSAQIRISK